MTIILTAGPCRRWLRSDQIVFDDQDRLSGVAEFVGVVWRDSLV
jgi:hypothetical protein